MIRLLHGDCRAILPTLAAGSVQCVVTSPPYFGLRDYGTGTWSGGDPNCDHTDKQTYGKGRGSGVFYDGGLPEHLKERPVLGRRCSCGAVRLDSQIGLEASPAEYIAEMVAVFREVRRVLRDDGTVWLNLGDSYAGSGKGGNPADSPHQKQATNTGSLSVMGKKSDGTKPKDLMMIPASVAIALRDDGWYLRKDIIWAKPNPMPESATDRPTSSHEHVFLLAKRPTYFYDADAVKEEAAWTRENNPDWQVQRAETNAKKGAGNRNAADGGFTKWTAADGRNLRDVWTIATAPYPEAHFATFPPALAELCIKAGSQPGDTILDPFSGSGTVGMVADRLRRNAIGIDLNGGYVAMSQNRIFADNPLFVEIVSG